MMNRKPIDTTNLNAIVFNTAADSSGAIAELSRFKAEAEKAFGGSINWLYVLGLAEMPEGSRAHIRRFPWTKKNWLARLFFDIFFARRLAREANANLVVSLQNTIIVCDKVPQVLFVQLCFPFIKYRFPIKEPRLWLYQNIVGAFSLYSIRKADLVVVQNQWMKNACAEKAGVNAEKIKVLRQDFVPPAIMRRFDSSTNVHKLFFYPATAKSYKNHRLLLDGAIIANRDYGIGPSLVFTLSKDEGERLLKSKAAAIEAGIDTEFRGFMTRDDVFKMYSQSVLVFPSLLETVGLPLVEAKAVGSIILAYDAEYSRDVLRGYSDVHFFNDAHSLAALLVECMEGRLIYHGGIDSLTREGHDWAEIIEEFEHKVLEERKTK